MAWGFWKKIKRAASKIAGGVKSAIHKIADITKKVDVPRILDTAADIAGKTKYKSKLTPILDKTRDFYSKAAPIVDKLDSAVNYSSNTFTPRFKSEW